MRGMLIEDVNQELLIDKLFERMTTEEAGARLLDLAAERAAAQAPELQANLSRMAEQERHHAVLLADVLRRFGRVPGQEQTRGAELARRTMTPLLQLASEPTVSIDAVLQLLLQAELADQAAWEILEELGKRATLDEDVLRDFRHAARTEKEHTHWVRTHLAQRLESELSLR
jgi:rubrerythrin